jgi:hypothetical protein
MALTVNQRRWLLGTALALTLSAVAAIQGNDETDSSLVQEDPAKVRQSTLKNGVDVELTESNSLLKMNRQRLPENEKDMFAGKSWFVPPPPPKAELPTAPPLPFIYMGKLAEEGEKVVILLTKQNRSYQVREGDVLDNTYRVDEVQPPVMTLTYIPLNIKQTIQIGVVN